MLTISLISLPQGFEHKFPNAILKHILAQSFFFLSLQLFSFIILTVCLIRIPSMILDILYKEINLTKTASINEVAERVAKWKENWLLICDLVAVVNSFIGWPLFIFIIYGFFIFVSFTFTVLFRILTTNERSLSSNFITMYFILKFFAYLCLLAFAAEKLPSKVKITE